MGQELEWCPGRWKPSGTMAGASVVAETQQGLCRGVGGGIRVPGEPRWVTGHGPCRLGAICGEELVCRYREWGHETESWPRGWWSESHLVSGLCKLKQTEANHCFSQIWATVLGAEIFIFNVRMCPHIRLQVRKKENYSHSNVFAISSVLHIFDKTSTLSPLPSYSYKTLPSEGPLDNDSDCAFHRS